jgi:hypothetical protein
VLLVVIPGLLLLALPALWGFSEGAGEMLILVRVSDGAGISASFVAVFASAVLEAGARAGGVSVLGEPALGVPEPEGPPSLASLRWRIASIVSRSGASGVDAGGGGGGGGCSFWSIFLGVGGDTRLDRAVERRSWGGDVGESRDRQG